VTSPISRLELVLTRNPFAGSSLPPDQLKTQSEMFVAMFDLAVDTEREDEEIWAYGKMKQAYRDLKGHPSDDPAHNLPRGMWEAMHWAAELRAAREAADVTSARAS